MNPLNTTAKLDYQAIFESTFEAMFIHDAASGRVINVNQTMVKMFGFQSKQEILDADQAVLSSGEPGFGPQAALAKLQEAKKKGFTVFEWHSRKKNGDLFWTEVSLRYIAAQNIILALARDISYRKSLEYRKNISEENLRMIVRHAKDPIFIKDTNGNYRLVNQAMADLLGRPIQEIVGRRRDVFFQDNRSKKVHHQDQRVLRGEVVRYTDVISVAGRSIHFQLTKIPVKDEDGEIRGILGIATDISRQVHTIQQLQDIRKRLETVIREAPIAIALLRDGIYLEVNPAYRKMFRIAPKDPVRGKSLLHQIAPSARADIAEKIDRRKTGDPVASDYETRGLRTDGSEFPFQVYASRLVLEEGPMTIAFLVDLSEKREAEQSLHFLITAIEQSHEGVAIADLDGNITYVNPRWAEMHGSTVDEITGRNLSVFHTEEQKQKEVIPFNEKVMKNGSHAGEVGHVTADGITFPTYMLTTLLRDSSGKPYAILGTARDMTEEKEFKQDLLKSQRNLEKAQEIGKTGFIEWNLKTNSIYLSNAVSQMFGLEPDMEWYPDSFIKKMVPPDDYERVSENLYAAIERNQKFNMEHRIIRPDQSLIWVHGQAERVMDEQGNPAFLLGYVQDITERKQSEMQQEQLRAELFQAQKLESIGRLAGGVAHDFNNMLSVILGYGEVLMYDMGPDHPFYPKISSIYDAGTRAQNLTRQLLAFSRKQTLEMKAVSLSNIISGFINLIKRLLPEDIALETELPPEQLLVEADTAQMEQVLLNLAVNARDAMPEGGTLLIRLKKCLVGSNIPDLKEGEYAKISVIDNGQGISEEVRQKIFEPFFTTKGQGQGTGLGLSTCFGIVAQHKGRITVKSLPGHGTTFDIFLPMKEGEAVSGSVPDTFLLKRPELTGTETILLVEDETDVRNLAKTILEQNGYVVIEATNGGMAVELASLNRNISLLLTDIVMPEMKGPEVYEKVRRLNPNIKVLYMSGYSEEVIGNHGLSNTDSQYIQKPFSMYTLISKIYKLLHPDG